MKPPEQHRRSALAAAHWAGVTLHEAQLELLERYAEWLRREALPAGGLGPREATRVWDRHLADSLTFARPWAGRTEGSIVDLGSGVGLPGLVLAVAFPDAEVTLVDRAGRRVELLRRAVRVLGLGNVSVLQAEIERLSGSWDLVAMRAVLGPERAVPSLRRVMAPGGVGVVGLRRGVSPPAPVGADGVEVVGVPPYVLDSPAWLLIIHPRDH